jgi:hypothetical protein
VDDGSGGGGGEVPFRVLARADEACGRRGLVGRVSVSGGIGAGFTGPTVMESRKLK